jgi:hypothetical protein
LIKQLGTTGAEFSNDGFDTFQQSFLRSGAADAKLIKELSESEFVVVVETKGW